MGLEAEIESLVRWAAELDLARIARTSLASSHYTTPFPAYSTQEGAVTLSSITVELEKAFFGARKVELKLLSFDAEDKHVSVVGFHTKKLHIDGNVPQQQTRRARKAIINLACVDYILFEQPYFNRFVGDLADLDDIFTDDPGSEPTKLHERLLELWPEEVLIPDPFQPHTLRLYKRSDIAKAGHPPQGGGGPHPSIAGPQISAGPPDPGPSE